ncbi:MAG: cytochrome b/b6 domain-containing protein [Saprospiraceae bacterium]|nr:cytochrome b/b6 domain-containing protein [Saprospiraceae bacterium]
MKVNIVHKHPLVIRWMHWINFPLLTIMIWSGVLIYWANDVYEIRIGNLVLFNFFPEWFYKLFNLPYRLSEGMAYHFVFMWLFFINGALYVIYTLVSGEWKYLIPQKNSLAESLQVIRHNLGLIKTLPPQTKYNGAQRIAYTMIVIMGLGSILTGLAIYKPVQLQWLTNLCGGYEAARAEHFFLTIGYVLFFFVHLFQVIRAGWNNFRAMVTGYEIESSKEEPK